MTATCVPLTREKRSIRASRSWSPKKSPSNLKVNGVGWMPPPAAGVAPAAPGASGVESITLTARKSTFALRAALSSWKTSEGTSALAGTALPSRATVA